MLGRRLQKEFRSVSFSACYLPCPWRHNPSGGQLPEASSIRPAGRLPEPQWRWWMKAHSWNPACQYERAWLLRVLLGASGGSVAKLGDGADPAL